MSVWIVVLIILISVAAIAMSGYAAYYYFTSDEPIACKMDAKVCPDGSSVGRISPDCEFAECPEVIDPTADWQMYRNEEYGFELKHPTNWRKIENDGFIGFGPQTIASDSIFTIYKDKSIPEVGAGSNSNQEITKVEDIQFKGLAAKNISIKNISLNKVSNRIFMNYNDFILSIGQSTINNTDYPFDHKYNNIIDEILSTFKFIEIKDKQETMTPPERLCFDNGGSFVVRDGENFLYFFRWKRMW